MSHRMYLAVMLYGSDVEEAEIMMPNNCSLDRSILGVGCSIDGCCETNQSTRTWKQSFNAKSQS